MDTANQLRLLAEAIDVYEYFGYKYVDVHWIEFTESIAETVSLDKIITVNIPGVVGPSNHGLIGSAEQSFIADYSYLNGKYVSFSPCFRMEDEFDYLHRMQFLKVELFQNDDVSDEALEKMIQDAFDFHSVLANKFTSNYVISIIETDIGYDILINGIEVGSYGRRTLKNGKRFLYGTGLAMPRCAQALGSFNGS